MTDRWIAYEAAARGIARYRHRERGDEPEPTPTDRLLARAAVDAAMPYMTGQGQEEAHDRPH